MSQYSYGQKTHLSKNLAPASKPSEKTLVTNVSIMKLTKNTVIKDLANQLVNPPRNDSNKMLQ